MNGSVVSWGHHQGESEQALKEESMLMNYDRKLQELAGADEEILNNVAEDVYG